MMNAKNIRLREDIITGVLLLFVLAGILSAFAVAFGYWFYKRPATKITPETFIKIDTTGSNRSKKPWASFSNDTLTMYLPDDLSPCGLFFETPREHDVYINDSAVWKAQ